jgi:signal transduction histidine kinase
MPGLDKVEKESPSETELAIEFTDGVARSRTQLEEELERLQGVVRELSYVIHGLSHDLREPIRSISCYVDLLQLRAPASDTNIREYAHFIRSAAERMNALVAGMLDYARMVGAEKQPDVPVDMNAVLQTALANLQMKIEEAGATIVHDELPSVWGDFVQLTQVVQNLVSNAIAYRSAAPPQIFVKADRGDDCWRFSIRDNGVGIEPLYLEQLFVPFKRLHGREIPGAGLGLAICRFIVERHGGRIWADSAPGQGTTFRFTLPFPIR